MKKGARRDSAQRNPNTDMTTRRVSGDISIQKRSENPFTRSHPTTWVSRLARRLASSVKYRRSISNSRHSTHYRDACLRLARLAAALRCTQDSQRHNAFSGCEVCCTFVCAFFLSYLYLRVCPAITLRSRMAGLDSPNGFFVRGFYYHHRAVVVSHSHASFVWLLWFRSTNNHRSFS